MTGKRRSQPLSPAARVARAQARQDADGWRRLSLRLPPAAAALLAAGERKYGTATAAIIEALKRL